MKKCCIASLISAGVVILLVAIGVIVFLNLTPAKLHIEDTSLGNGTIADYGLADVKIITLIKSVRKMSKKEEKVVEHPYNAEDEKAEANKLFANSNYANKTNYSGLLAQNAEYDVSRVREAKDTTLAYILDTALTKAYEDAESAKNGNNGNYASNDGTVSTQSDEGEAMFSVRELAITKDESTNMGKMRIVLGVAVIDSATKEAMSSGAGALVKVPEYVYIVCSADFTISSGITNDGKLVFSNYSAYIGDESNPLNSLFLGLFNSAMGTEPLDKSKNGEVFGQFVFDEVSATLGHIGRVGTAYTTMGDMAVNPTIGMGGVQEGKLTFITYTAADNLF